MSADNNQLDQRENDDLQVDDLEEDEQHLEAEELVTLSFPMANDSRFVLAQLVHSGIWSELADPFKHKHFVLDADSAVTYLYKRCLLNHLKRQRALKTKTKSTLNNRNKPRNHLQEGEAELDHYAATIVNFQEFGQCVEQLLAFFASHSISLHIVYRGKHMEAPLFGLLPAQIKKNVQRASEQLNMLLEHTGEKSTSSTSSKVARTPSNSSTTSSSSSSASNLAGKRPNSQLIERHLALARPSRSNLALNIFKQIVNEHCKRAAKSKAPNARLKTHQAFYSPFPSLAKLARDFKCPVLTNDADFIIMDVRAGFLLFEDFYQTYLSNPSVLSRFPSTSSVRSTASSASGTKSLASSSPRSKSRSGSSKNVVSPKSPAVGLADAKSLFSQPSKGSRVRFHLNALFLRQHPGLNQALVLHLFPLTTGEFIITHAKSMVKMRIYDREFGDQDLMMAPRDLSTNSRGGLNNRKYHMAAARLEMVSRYLCTKDPELLNSLLKGEAHRLLASGSTFDEDYKELFNYYAVVYDFKQRLKLVLKYLPESLSNELSYIESCLLERECSADFLLSLLCCSIGRMSSICYNKSLQFEDLQTRHSAFSMLDSARRLVMRLTGDNKPHKSEHSAALSEQQRNKISSRFKMAALTLVDRQQQQLIERTIDFSASKQDQASTQLTLAALAKRARPAANNHAAIHNGQHQADTAALMELAFNQQSGAFVKLAPAKLAHLVRDAAGGPADAMAQRQLQQLAVMLNLHRFSVWQAALDDAYFKSNYLKLSQFFEMALAQHFIHLTDHLSSSKTLIDLINKLDFENVARINNPIVGVKQQKQTTTATTNSETVSTRKSRLNSSKNQDSVPMGRSGSKTVLSKTLSKQAANEPKLSGANNGELTAAPVIRRRVRHLIELFNSSLEAYCELNAFLNYPMPQLDLGRHYNPILLFNLTLHNLSEQNHQQ